MSRYTLARDFRSIDPRQTRVILVEAGPRILPSFDGKLAARAMRDLEALGVQVWTHALVTNVDASGVSGAFSRPQVDVAKAPLAARAAGAVALGALLTPLASILAFIDPGLADDSDCAALLTEARQRGEPRR